MAASVDFTSVEAFVKASVEVASVEVASVEAFIGASVKVTPWKLSWQLPWILLPWKLS